MGIKKYEKLWVDEATLPAPLEAPVAKPMAAEMSSEAPEVEEKIVRVLILDESNVHAMLEGSSRPVELYDRVTYLASSVPENQTSFCAMLAYRAVAPGGVLLVPLSVSELPQFVLCRKEPVGELIRISKP